MVIDRIFGEARNTTYAAAVRHGLLPADSAVPFVLEDGPFPVRHTEPGCHTAPSAPLGVGTAGDLLTDPDAWCLVCRPQVTSWKAAASGDEIGWLHWLGAVDTLEQRVADHDPERDDDGAGTELVGEVRLLVTTGTGTPPPRLAANVATAHRLLGDLLTEVLGELPAPTAGPADDGPDGPTVWWLLLPRWHGYRQGAHDPLEPHVPAIRDMLAVLGEADVHGMVAGSGVTVNDVRLLGALLVRSPDDGRRRVEQQLPTQLTATVLVCRDGDLAGEHVQTALGLLGEVESLAAIPDALEPLAAALAAGDIPPAA